MQIYAIDFAKFMQKRHKKSNLSVANILSFLRCRAQQYIILLLSIYVCFLRSLTPSFAGWQSGSVSGGARLAADLR